VFPDAFRLRSKRLSWIALLLFRTVRTGINFADGAKLLVNGETRKTIYESATQLTGKKLGKSINRGDKVQVRNPDGSLSNEWTY
jgi:hypothetical protein